MIKGRNAMKRIIIIAAVLLAASCSSEVVPGPEDHGEVQEAKTYKVNLTASFDPETRILYDSSSGVATWSETDKIAVFTEQGRLVEGVITEMSATRPTFTFTIENGDAIKIGATAYYPASIAVADHPDQIVLPASFENTATASQSVPMKAVVTNGEIALPFKHLASIVYVNAPTSTPSYPGEGREPNKVLFSVGDGNSPITGKFTVGSDLTLTAAGDNGTTVQVPWTSGQPYYFFLPAATYSQGFSISITSADGFTFYRKKRSSSYTAERAHLLNMPAFNPQCKVFYLTSTATEWSDSEPLARMIQTGENSFLGALYSFKGSKAEWDLGLRILQGYNLGTHWNNVIGGIQNTDLATFGEQVGNFNGAPAGVYKVSITLYDNNWRYTSEWVNNEYHHDNMYLVGSFDGWSAQGIALIQKVGHNWYAEVEVGAGKTLEPDTQYTWKINNGSWDVQWGSGTISSSNLSTYVDFNQNSSNGTLTLPAGTYEIFFNDAIGWIMFVKK